MEEQDLSAIIQHLQNEKVQKQIRQNIAKGRAEATIRIGWAARLFDFSDTQLRDYETRGLLRPSRSKDTATGQRQFSLDELDKLAIIRVLLEARFTPSQIPSNIDEIWRRIDASSDYGLYRSRIDEKRTVPPHIDRRVEEANETLFSRFYTLQAVRLSLVLLREEISAAVTGLILPLHRKNSASLSLNTDDLPNLGESLIGWLISGNSFYIFLDSAPSFEYPSDYQLHRLQAEDEDAPKDSTLLVSPRKAKAPSFNMEVVEIVRRLLAPFYEDVQNSSGDDWRTYFTQSLRDIMYSVTDFQSSPNFPDRILNELAERVVRLGGLSQRGTGEDRWRFCCVLMPNNDTLPMQQRRLIVYAQSRRGPHTLGVTTVSPEKAVISLSSRAFQSGHIISRWEISAEDATIFHREVEGKIGSAIAVPVEGEDGSAIAVIYVVSDEPEAFSESDQRVLRMVGRMIEDLLLTYRIRLRATVKLSDIIKKPRVVDSLFGDFFSENGFLCDVENLLATIQATTPKEGTPEGDKELSFISIDIDNQTSLSSMYGDRVTRNLSRTLGERLNSQLRVLFTKRTDWSFYRIYADRYYLMLDGTSLEQACEKAEQLREKLNGPYMIDALRTSVEQSSLPANALKLPNITVRLGVTSYPYWKLAELLARYHDATPIASVRSLIARFLDIALNEGKQKGGNIVIAWDRKKWRLLPWYPQE